MNLNQYLDCDGNCVNDADGDGVCDEIEIAGCNDPIACNYDEDATDNDGSCDYNSCIIYGCTLHSLVTTIQTLLQTTVAVISILVSHLVVLTLQLVTTTQTLHTLTVLVSTVLVQVV